MKLEGKTAWFWLEGFRSGRILRIDRGPRIGLRAIVVRLVDGRRRKLSPRAFITAPAGILFRGQIVRLEAALPPP